MSIRRLTQLYFLGFYIVAGYLFKLLVSSRLNGGTADFSLRFSGIESFLPLSSLVGLKQLIGIGTFDEIHPAGLSILLLTITAALILRRGTCSHICPIGTISELLYDLRSKIGGIRPLPKTLHYLLMLPKYLLLIFFIKVILIDMSGSDAAAFTHTPYNIIADAKMLNFFLNPSPLTVKVLLFLVVMNTIIPFFWCRYLCPYGALLNIPALFSPLKIKKEQKLCDSCGICDRQCPGNLAISSLPQITSPECTGCYRCISSCPTKALTFSYRLTRHPFKPLHYSFMLIAIFTLGIILAKVSGHWDSPTLALLWSKYLPQLSTISHP